MDRVQEYFLESIKWAIRGKKAPEICLEDKEWQQVFALASAHHLLPLIFDVVREIPQLKEKDTFSGIKMSVRHQIFLHIQKTAEFLKLYQHLRDKGISSLVVKGAVCRSLYPNPDLRISSDEDLLIPKEQTETCHQVMLADGLGTAVADEDICHQHEIPYRKVGSPLYIELHRSLFPEESDAYGDLNSFFKDVFECPAEIEVQGTNLLTLSPENHIFYLICHAFKHFLHSGFGLRQVCDILLFAERYRDTVNWTRVYEKSKAIRAEYFTASLFKIGTQHLGFEPDKLPKEFLSMNIDEEPMLMDLLEAGVFGSSTMSRRHSSNITLDAVASGKRGKRSKNSLLLSLFPSSKSLESRYPYLKGKPYLLPMAWAQRIASYGKETAKQHNNSAAEALRIGSERRELLKKYNIID